MTQPHDQKIRIAVCDDNVIYRQGLKALFSAEPDLEVVPEIVDLKDARENAEVARYDVLVVDLAKAQQGRSEIFSARQAHPGLEVLILTSQDGPEQLKEALACGARAYMLKGSSPDQLVWAVRALRGNSSGTNAAGITATVSDLQALARSQETFDAPTGLTPREVQTLQMLVDGKTVRDIAGALSLSPKTVESHKLNLMRKLNIHNRTALVEYAVEHALVKK